MLLLLMHVLLDLNYICTILPIILHIMSAESSCRNVSSVAKASFSVNFIPGNRVSNELDLTYRRFSSQTRISIIEIDI